MLPCFEFERDCHRTAHAAGNARNRNSPVRTNMKLAWQPLCLVIVVLPRFSESQFRIGPEIAWLSRGGLSAGKLDDSFRSVNGQMKRVIVQVLTVESRSADLATDAFNKPDTEPEVIPINGGSRSSTPKDRDDDTRGVRLEAVVSAERAQTVVDTVLNVNELENIDSFDRLVDMLIQRELENDESGQLFHRVMSSVEKALIEKAYVECGQVQTRTAERLGVNRNTIHKKLLKHELLDPEVVEVNIRQNVVIEKRKCV